MRYTRRLSLTAGAVLMILACSLVLQGATREAGSRPVHRGALEFASGEIIVGMEAGATRRDLRELNRRNGARIEEELPGDEVSLVDLPPGLAVREAVALYERSPQVEYAEPNYRIEAEKTPNDADYYRSWGLHNTGQTILGVAGVADADIDAPEAWDVTAGAAVPVAVIDTGVDVRHRDLAANVWKNPGEVAGNGRDDDGNGYVDDVNGWDFYNADASVYDPEDGEEHGTHVAGIIAAAGNNDAGTTGVSWRAKIAVLKFMGPDGGYVSDAVAAIDYAIAQGIKISNNSWGSEWNSRTLREAIARADAAGHLFVAAAGNAGADNDSLPHYPSSYSLPNVVAVAASNNRDRLAPFSNYGAASVDLAAPGVAIYSTLPGGKYGHYSGTSMAAPHVAGVAALLKGEYPSLDNAGLRDRILAAVDRRAAFEGRLLTGGRLNAAGALNRDGKSALLPADATKPTISAVRPKRTRDRTPLIAATVRDERTNLRKKSIRLYVDGRRKTRFSYDAKTDRLRHESRRLSYGRHRVRIVARDAAGNVVAKSWILRVVRR